MTIVPRIEIQPVSHCTLACHGCQHGIPARGRNIHHVEDYLLHLNRLSKFCQWESLIIGGGEPFLHPDLAGFISSCKLGRPAYVITNGFWLLRGDWYEVAKPVFLASSAIVVSRYPPYVDRLGINEWDSRLNHLAERTGCRVSSFHPRDPAGLTFDFHEHHNEPRTIVRECTMRRCLQLLPDGRLARCPLGRWSDLNWHLDKASFTAAYRESGFYDLDRGGEGFPGWVNPETFAACHYCGLATGEVSTRLWRTIS